MLEANQFPDEARSLIHVSSCAEHLQPEYELPKQEVFKRFYKTGYVLGRCEMVEPMKAGIDHGCGYR